MVRTAASPFFFSRALCFGILPPAGPPLGPRRCAGCIVAAGGGREGGLTGRGGSGGVSGDSGGTYAFGVSGERARHPRLFESLVPAFDRLLMGFLSAFDRSTVRQNVVPVDTGRSDRSDVKRASERTNTSVHPYDSSDRSSIDHL